MDLNDFLGAGSDILKDVSHAVENGDFDGLSERVQRRVTDVIDEYRTSSDPSYMHKEAWKPGTGSGRKASQSTTYQSTYRNYSRTASSRTGDYVDSTYRELSQDGSSTRSGVPEHYREQNYFLSKKVSRYGGMVRCVLGGLATGVSALFVAGIVASGIAFGMMSNTLAMAACFGVGAAGAIVNALSIKSIIRGSKYQGLVDQFYRFGQRLAGKEFFSVKELASRVHMDEAKVRTDLIAMMKEGFLPNAVMDEQGTTVMLTDHAVQLYQDATRSLHEREMYQAVEEAQKSAPKAQDQKSAGAFQTTDPAARAILREGNEYIAKIRFANDEIPDTDEMSDKLYRLEDIVKRIFRQVEKNPGAAGDMRRVMDYYLPTTQKLLDAYVELYREGSSGDNVQKTKEEIESAIDTVCDAFEKLLDQMFQDTAWDIASDINVMKTMLAQDGLSGNGT